MLVGVGAARIRDLFEKARERQPAIIFIDELDSVGRKRGSQSTIGSNNEQEQTLDQLLKELDGFDPREGIVILAATNRPEMLDDALLRPGRFDRQVVVPLPTQDDREAILGVHTRGEPLDDAVDPSVVARSTPGFSGAQLENLVNEAAITAVREGRERIRQADFDAARDRIVIGRRQNSDLLQADERHRVADPVFDEQSTGAAQDLAQATELATRMVREFGLSDALGPVGYRASDEPGACRGWRAVRTPRTRSSGSTRRPPRSSGRPRSTRSGSSRRTARASTRSWRRCSSANSSMARRWPACSARASCFRRGRTPAGGARHRAGPWAVCRC
jgi:ATP-dependent Zn protease